MIDAHRAAGRPRSGASEAAILTATLDLLAEAGFDGTSTDAIATRARVSKATIYRRWSSKDEVVLAAVASLGSDVPTPDTGCLEGDLAALVDGLVAVFADDRSARLISTLIDQMARKPAFATAMRGGFVRARREVAADVLQRAQDRGELELTAGDRSFALDLLVAPLYYRVLVIGESVDRAYGSQVTASVLAWLQHAGRVRGQA